MAVGELLVVPLYHPAQVGLFIAIWLVGLVTYRLYLHPLAKFPGPKLAAITDYWELYQDYFREESGHLYLELDELHRRYGPIVRIRPNEVHVKDSNWTDVLYSGPSDHRDRDPLVGTAIGTPLATIGTGPHNLHRKRKAAIAPFFSTRSVVGMEPQIARHTDKLLRDLGKRTGQILDMRVYTFAWTTDYITETIFHNSTELFWDPERADPWFGIVWNFSAKFPLTKHMPWLVTTGLALPLVVWKLFFPSLVPYISIYKNLLDKASRAASSFDMTNSKTDKTVSSDTLSKDIFETILSSNLPAEETTPKRMANEVFNLLIAGSLTTSKATTLAIFHVLHNPSVYQTLRKELQHAIQGSQSMPSVQALQKLPYLTAVIKETMRIGCIVTTRFPMISPHKDLKHGDNILPAGSSISMTFCKASMDPQIFAAPEQFRPERWLDDSQQPLDYERYVLPFGRGSRICIGQHLSYAQLYLLLAGIFRRFDLELFETIRERDIDIKGGGPLGEPTRKTKGVRIRVLGPVNT